MLDENIDKLPQKNEENPQSENEKVDSSSSISEEIKEELKSEEIVEIEDSTEKEDEEKEERGTPVSNDEPAKKVVKKTESEISSLDFAKLSIDELVAKFSKLYNEYEIKEYKNRFEDIKSSFNKKYRDILNEKKASFVKEGGDEKEFTFYHPVKQEFNDLVRSFKKKRQEYYKQIELEQKNNLERKYHLIEKLKGLIDNAEPASMYKDFQDLQKDWRSIGQIPRAQYNDVWQTYHHHVERFYDLLHLNKEFRDLDFKHNLEEKIKLVERAEKLVDLKDVDKAFRELQVLHKMWKEDIGPVAREQRDDVWNKFSEATKLIHHKRHQIQKELESKFEENVDKKIAVIDKIKAIDVDKINSHKEWLQSIKKVEAIRDEFFKVGRVPNAKNEEIWQLFKDATRKFNRAKNAFYKNVKNEQHENLTKKMHLVEQAESLKESEDWDIVTDVFKKIQSDWKKIGHVPKKDSDVIWKRFKDACNHYFDRLHGKQDDSNKEFTEIMNNKKEFLLEVKENTAEGKEFDLSVVNEYIKKWRDLGSLPHKMNHIESKFNKVIDYAYNLLNIDKEEALFLKFQNIVNGYYDGKDYRKLDHEQMFIRKKIDEITREIKQLENNVSFISNVTEDNPLVQNVMKNIDKHKKDLELWKKKLKYLKSLDY